METASSAIRVRFCRDDGVREISDLAISMAAAPSLLLPRLPCRGLEPC